MRQGKTNKTEDTHYFELDGLLYYLSHPDTEDPLLRLYIPQKLEKTVLKQYHDELGHMSTDKTYDTMRLKYYFPNMYKKISTHVEKCITCQMRSDKKTKPPLQETDIPPYPFAKIGLDMSGPYPTTLAGNKYIVSFVDLYSSWPEAWPVKDKTADTIANLIIEEIIPRHGCPLEIVSDNGTENINRKVKETLEALNIHHVKTSYYSPQSNSRVERFHRTLHDVMSKKIEEDVNTWDLYLNQTLAAIRFHVSEATSYSPFFLVYNRDVVLPLDSILKPRRRYLGEDQHRIALEQQHKSFIRVHRHMRKKKEIQKKYADRGSKEVEFKVGDPIFLRNHHRNSKLDNKWVPYFRITGKTGPLSFRVRNQLNGEETKSHARHMRLAPVREWKILKDESGSINRKSTYVVPPDSGEDSDEEPLTEKQLAFKRAVENKRQERNSSSDEEDIPLMELRKRLQLKASYSQNEDRASREELEY